MVAGVALAGISSGETLDAYFTKTPAVQNNKVIFGVGRKHMGDHYATFFVTMQRVHVANGVPDAKSFEDLTITDSYLQITAHPKAGKSVLVDNPDQTLREINLAEVFQPKPGDVVRFRLKVEGLQDSGLPETWTHPESKVIFSDWLEYTRPTEVKESDKAPAQPTAPPHAP